MILSLYQASLHALNSATGQVLSIRRRRTTIPQVVTLIAGSRQRSVLIAGNTEEMFMTGSLNVTPKTTEQHLIARSDKSVACVTNNILYIFIHHQDGSTIYIRRLNKIYNLTKKQHRPMKQSSPNAYAMRYTRLA